MGNKNELQLQAAALLIHVNSRGVGSLDAMFPNLFFSFVTKNISGSAQLTRLRIVHSYNLINHNSNYSLTNELTFQISWRQ